MTTKRSAQDVLMGKAINRLRFKTYIWGNFADWERTYKMVNDVRTLTGLPRMSLEMFREGWQYCHIFSDDYKYALQEFKALCWGDW